MAAASHALVEMLGISRAPLLALAELNEGVMRVPWLGRVRRPDSPAFSVGLEGIDEEAVRIFLLEEREAAPGEPGAYRIPHLDEGGFRPGLHAVLRPVLRPAGWPVGHAVAAAVAVALARAALGEIVDGGEGWVEAVGGSAAHSPESFSAALRAQRRFASVTDGAQALYARRPSKKPAPAG
jgi:hypothetical protein